jgi:hypothetical protein
MLWLSLAVLSAALAALTLVVPDWFEGLFGWSPDAASGSFEWLIVGTSSAVSLISWRRVALRLRLVR